MTLKAQLSALCVLIAVAFAIVSLSPSDADADTVPARVPPTLSDRGNFRFRCEFSHLGADDPLVAPNQPGASHLHMFFGNTETSAYSSPGSIRSSGGSTCQGGASANRSAYWIPSVHDSQGRVRVPDYALVYYKTNGLDPGSVQIMPQDLRIIAGNSGGGNNDNVAYWSCMNNGSFQKSTTIPDCPAGKTLLLSVHFPVCWDGTNLDSRDHKSHMSYGVWSSSGRTCPSSHPVPLPEITYSFQYTHPEGGTNGWYLSSDRASGANHAGGSTLHGDWMNGWDRSVMQNFVSNCLHARRDCTGGELGDGTKLTPTGNGSGSAAIIDSPGGGQSPTPAPPPEARSPETTTTTTTNSPLPEITTTTAADSLRPETTARLTTTTTTEAPESAPPETAEPQSSQPSAAEPPASSGAAAAVREPGPARVAGEPAKRCMGRIATIVGTSGRDVLHGTPGPDVIWAGDGNDVIFAGRGRDIICSGRGHDRVRAGTGPDTVVAGPGRDRLSGGGGRDDLHGQAGRDRIRGGPGNDVLVGGPGDDILRGNRGRDLLVD